MTTALAVYDIFQGTQVRKVDRGDGKVWRVFADCCKALGFQGKPSNQLNRIPKQHTDLIGLLAQDGCTRKQWVIDEIGLMALIAYSRLPKEQVDAFRELIGQRATAPQIINIDEIVKLAVREAVREIHATQGMRDMQFDVRIARLETENKPKKRTPKLAAGHEDKRAVVNNLINEIIDSRGIDGWEIGKLRNDFYRKLGDAHGRDFIAAGKAMKRKTLDVIEKEGLIDELIGMIKGK